MGEHVIAPDIIDECTKIHDGPCIYGLSGADGLIRYIGQTKHLERRMGHHMRWYVIAAPKTAKDRWISECCQRGEAIRVAVIEQTSDLDARERHWIAFFRSQGRNLLNATDGGPTPSHLHRKALKRKWKGWSPLQSIRAQLSMGVNSFERAGNRKAARRLKAKILQINAAIDRACKREGRQQATDRFNEALFMRFPNRGWQRAE